MLLSYILNALKFKKWELFSILFILLVVKRSPFTWILNPDAEMEKCPACFGTSACDQFNRLTFESNDFRQLFDRFFNVRNVYFASLDGEKVVVKKLASNSEWKKFDSSLENLESFESILEKKSDETEVKLHLCNSAKSRLHDLLSNVYRNNVQLDKRTLRVNIATALTVNPEPLLLQILPRSENWPVPRYHGACGRMVIEEFVSASLTSHFSSPFKTRAKIAASLLNAAEDFTFRHPEFSFYLTDVSADNVAVDEELNARFIDLEDAVVSLRDKSGLQRVQTNTDDSSCATCLEFSPADVCESSVSDHNYYAVCKALLANNASNEQLPHGLLHDVPLEISKKHPELGYLLEQCAKPTNSSKLNRIEAGNKLKQLLEHL